MTDSLTIREIGAHLLCMSERVRLFGVTAADATTLDNYIEGLRTIALAMRAELRVGQEGMGNED